MRSTFFVILTMISTAFFSELSSADTRELLKNPDTLKKIQNFQSISDEEYDELRKQVLAALAKDKLIVEADFNYSEIGLGYNNLGGYMLVESKREARNYINFNVYPDRIEVRSIYGGKELKDAFQTYMNSLGNNDLQSQLFRISGIRYNLPYFIAVLRKAVAPLAIELDKFEFDHDTTYVLNGTMEYGANKGKELIQISFKVRDFDYSSISPGPGISISNFGVVYFNPPVRVGDITTDQAVGSCVRVCKSAQFIECLDMTARRSCESQEAFESKPRCPTITEWYQGLSCPIAEQLSD